MLADMYGLGGSAAARGGIGESAPFGTAGVPVLKEVYSTAKSDPEAALSLLRSTVGAWYDDTVARFTEGRREAVCALVEMARRGVDFREVAPLLLRLEANGDTAWPCNAAHAFSSLFVNAPAHAIQGNADDRIALLEEMLGSQDGRQRRLALSACDMALESVEIMPWDCVDGRRPVPQFVRAPIGKERDGYKKTLQMLLGMVGGMERDEREKAVGMIRERAVEMSCIEGVSIPAADAIRFLYKNQLAGKGDLVQAAKKSLETCAGKMNSKAVDAWRSLVADLGG